MVAHHFWLSEEQFACLKPLLSNKTRGVKRVDDRHVNLGHRPRSAQRADVARRPRRAQLEGARGL